MMHVNTIGRLHQIKFSAVNSTFFFLYFRAHIKHTIYSMLACEDSFYMNLFLFNLVVSTEASVNYKRHAGSVYNSAVCVAGIAAK